MSHQQEFPVVSPDPLEGDGGPCFPDAPGDSELGVRRHAPCSGTSRWARTEPRPTAISSCASWKVLIAGSHACATLPGRLSTRPL